MYTLDDLMKKASVVFVKAQAFELLFAGQMKGKQESKTGSDPHLKAY